MNVFKAVGIEPLASDSIFSKDLREAFEGTDQGQDTSIL